MPLLKELFWGAIRRAVFAVVWAIIWHGELLPLFGPLWGWSPPPTGYGIAWVVINSMIYWCIFMVIYLRSYKFICPVCQNKDEPLGVLGYLRGHGAHEWHNV